MPICPLLEPSVCAVDDGETMLKLAAEAVLMPNGTQAASATAPMNLGVPKISDR
jgi:hypothetical protein